MHRSWPCAKLNEAEFAAGPGGGQSCEDERERIPVRTEGGAAIPRYGRADDAERQTDEAADQSVLHRPIGCDARCDVAARDAEDDAIDGGKQQCSVVAGHRCAPRREDAGCVQQLVSTERDNKDEDETGENGGCFVEYFVSGVFRS
jgi:hypothetical protein